MQTIHCRVDAVSSINNFNEKKFLEKQIGKSFKHSLRKHSICFSWIGFERLCDNRVGDVLFFTLLKCRLNNNILGRFYKSSQHIVYGCSSWYKVTTNTEPLCRVLVTEISPCKSFTISFTMESPNPVDPSPPVGLLESFLNFPNKFWISSGCIPGPWSMTSNRTSL